MRNERSISLPGLLLGFSVDGGVAAAAVPAAARTVLSLPQAALGDGTAQALRMRRMSGSRTGCILMSRGYPMFGAGGLSDAGLSAFRHEALRRLELPEDALALLLQGTRRELTPVGGLVERCTEAWKRAGGEALLPEGWTGFEMPFMTQDGVMRVGALSAGGAVPTENRVLLLATDVPVREVILQRIADRAAGPLFAWLRAVGVLSAADVVMVVSAAGRRPVASIDDPAAEMLARALELAVGRVSEAWAGALGRNIRVRLEGLRDEGEREHLGRSPLCFGPRSSRALFRDLRLRDLPCGWASAPTPCRLRRLRSFRICRKAGRPSRFSWLGAIFLRHFACSETSGEGVKIFSVRLVWGAVRKIKEKHRE